MRLFTLFIFLLVFCGIAEGQNFIRINSIEVQGLNRTDESLVLYELGISEGDTLFYANLSESVEIAQNRLLNTTLFNKVEIHFDYLTESDKNMIVTVSERWYFWFVPLVNFQDPNFSAWTEDKDLDRLNLGGNLLWQNVSGIGDVLGLKIAFGFSNEASLSYTRPYLGTNKNGTVNFQTWAKQVNKVHAFNDSDDRFFVESADNNLLEKFGIAVGYSHRINQNLSLNGSCIAERVTLNELNEADVLEYFRYFDGRSEVSYAEMKISFRSDLRNSRAYPTKGSYFDVALLHRADWEHRTGAILDYRKYLPLKNRWYFESGMHAESLSKSSGSLYFENGWGYKKTMRGYERRFSESPNFFSVRNNLKLEILKKKNLKFEKLRDQFRNSHIGMFLNFIGDFGYSSSRNALIESPIQDQWQYSFGLGLDAYTSYDKVIRIESTFNRQNEFNVFLHFVQPI